MPSPVYRIRTDGRNLFEEDPSVVEQEATFPLLGSSATVTGEHQEPFLTAFATKEHVAVGWFLSTVGAGGKTYDRTTTPSWFRSRLPDDATSILLLPVFSIDLTPIALIAVMVRDETYEFSSGHRAYLDQVGAIFQSSFLRRRLVQSDTAKSIFVSNISHELRTPLHVISGHCELLEQSILTTEQERCLRSIASSCTSLSETVNHVLEFSKAAAHPAGHDEAHFAELSEVDLAHFIEEVVDEVHLARLPLSSHRGSSRADSLSATVASSPGSVDWCSSPSPSAVPPTQSRVETLLDIQPRDAGWFVRVDRAGLRRTISNLYSNAQKYCAAGSVTISLRELPAPPSSSHINVEIAVTDTGRGMTQAFQRTNLFQPFSQE